MDCRLVEREPLPLFIPVGPLAVVGVHFLDGSTKYLDTSTERGPYCVMAERCLL